MQSVRYSALYMFFASGLSTLGLCNDPFYHNAFIPLIIFSMKHDAQTAIIWKLYKRSKYRTLVINISLFLIGVQRDAFSSKVKRSY